MNFPLSASDIGLWLTFTAIVLLITSELLLSSSKFLSRLNIEKKQLRLAALGCGLGVLIVVAARVFLPA